MVQNNSNFNLDGKKVFVAGHGGMVGSAIVRRLGLMKVEKVLTASRSDLDLTSQSSVNSWMSENQPDVIFLAAARVGGIFANNKYPAEFLYENLQIQSNVIHAAYVNKVEKLLFLGSSCIYPKHSEQPMKEEALLSGQLEQTNQWYAIAKIAGIKLCQAYRKQYGCDFISAMPTNLYGPGDNYHPDNSHVIPALIRKVEVAKQRSQTGIEIWGSGEIYREFMHVDDCADALVFLMEHYSDAKHVNVGCGQEVSINGVAREIMSIVGFSGDLSHDLSKPEGPRRKLLDTSFLLSLGWKPKYGLKEGLKDTYNILMDSKTRQRGW